MPSVSEFEVLQRMSNAFHQSGLYKNIGNVAQAIAIVQTGRELGIGPSMALREMYIISGQGRPTLSAALLNALVQRDHGDNAIRVVENTNEICRVKYQRRSWATPEYTSFSMDDARRAGLVKAGSNWEKYPRAMCRSRAISEACRAGFSDSIMGLYSTEELAPEDVTVTPDGELVYDAAATPAPAAATPLPPEHERATIETVGDRAIDVVTGEIVDPVASVPSAAAPKTPAQASGPMEPHSAPSGLTPFQQIELRIVQADTLALLQQVWKDVAGLNVKRAITQDERAALVVVKDRRKMHIDFAEKIAAAADTDALSAIQADIDAARAFEQIDQPSAALLTELVNERGGQVSDPPAPPATNAAAVVDDLALVEL